MPVYLKGGSAQTKFTCCHTETEVATQTFYLTQSQYTDTRSNSPSADPESDRERLRERAGKGEGAE